MEYLISSLFLFLAMKLPLKDYLFVAVQFILFAIYLLNVSLFPFQTPKYISYSGLTLSGLGILIGALALLQLNNNLSPFPSPKTNSELIKTGLYKFIRHPIYTGILLMLFGYGIFQGSSYKIGITLMLHILFYLKSSYEEVKLEAKYPGYSEYKKTSGRFLPRFYLS